MSRQIINWPKNAKAEKAEKLKSLHAAEPYAEPQPEHKKGLKQKI